MIAQIETPLLYSFRRCPYAMRARLAIKMSGIKLELREIELKNKPAHMLEISPKGTVPVVCLNDEQVLDESFDIMLWALTHKDPEGWMYPGQPTLLDDALMLIDKNDNEFKKHLDHYKYSVRFPESSEVSYREQGEKFLTELESRLGRTGFLVGRRFGLADAAIAPFIRQFAHVDKAWFDQSPYEHVKAWLSEFLESTLFKSVMVKYKPWEESGPILIFND